MARDKRITQVGLNKVRLALYNAKLCIESGFNGADRDVTIRTILDALDETRDLPDIPST